MAQQHASTWVKMDNSSTLSHALKGHGIVMQAYQHIYLALLYGLLAIKSILLDDFQSMLTGSIGPVSISKLTQQELAIFWGGKLLWLGYFVLLPAVQSHHSWSALAALWVLSEAVTGWILAFMFQVSADHRVTSAGCFKSRRT